MFLDFLARICYKTPIQFMQGLPRGCSTRRTKATDAPFHRNRTFSLPVLLNLSDAINPFHQCRSGKVCSVCNVLRSFCFLLLLLLPSLPSEGAGCSPPPANIIGWWPGD